MVIYASTARTFIHDGGTTEYATEVIYTNPDNARIYAHSTKKTSRVVYEGMTSLGLGRLTEDYSIASKMFLESSLHNSSPSVLEDKVNFPGDWSNIFLPMIDKKMDYIPFSQSNQLTSFSNNILPVLTANCHSVYNVDCSISELPIRFAVVKDMNINQRLDEPCSPKAITRQLSTVTYYGFADFTTVVGESVIIFSPNTPNSKINPLDSVLFTEDFTTNTRSTNISDTNLTNAHSSILEPTYILTSRITHGNYKTSEENMNPVRKETIYQYNSHVLTDKTMGTELEPPQNKKSYTYDIAHKTFPNFNLLHDQRKTDTPVDSFEVYSGDSSTSAIIYKLIDDQQVTDSISSLLENIKPSKVSSDLVVSLIGANESSLIVNTELTSSFVIDDSLQIIGKAKNLQGKLEGEIAYNDVNKYDNCKLTSKIFLPHGPTPVLKRTGMLISESASQQNFSQLELSSAIQINVQNVTQYFCIQTQTYTLNQPATFDGPRNMPHEINQEGILYKSAQSKSDSSQPTPLISVDALQKELESQTQLGEISNHVNSIDIDIIYKTLYTVYTYLTTYYQNATSSLRSQTEVLSNILISELDTSPTNAEIIVQHTKSGSGNNILKSSMSNIRSFEAEPFIKFENKLIKFTSGYLYISPTNTKYDVNIPIEQATFFTTYTFYTTIYSGTTNRVILNSAILQGSIQSLEATISPKKYIQSNTNGLSSIETLMTVPSTITNIGMYSVHMVDDKIQKNRHYELTEEISKNNANNVAKTTTKNIVSISRRHTYDTQFATLLLQTGFTTQTYFTTIYAGEKTDIISHLETVTTTITETYPISQTNKNIQELLPITYYTTFTFWTKLATENKITTISREETISNVVIPTTMLSTMTSLSDSTERYFIPSLADSLKQNRDNSKISLDIIFENALATNTYDVYNTFYDGVINVDGISPEAESSYRASTAKQAFYTHMRKSDFQKTSIIEIGTVSSTIAEESASQVHNNSITEDANTAVNNFNNHLHKQYALDTFELIETSSIINNTVSILQRNVSGIKPDCHYEKTMQTTSTSAAPPPRYLTSLNIGVDHLSLPPLHLNGNFKVINQFRNIDVLKMQITDIDNSESSENYLGDNAQIPFQLETKIFVSQMRPFVSHGRSHTARTELSKSINHSMTLQNSFSIDSMISQIPPSIRLEGSIMNFPMRTSAVLGLQRNSLGSSSVSSKVCLDIDLRSKSVNIISKINNVDRELCSQYRMPININTLVSSTEIGLSSSIYSHNYRNSLKKSNYHTYFFNSQMHYNKPQGLAKNRKISTNLNIVQTTSGPKLGTFHIPFMPSPAVAPEVYMIDSIKYKEKSDNENSIHHCIDNSDRICKSDQHFRRRRRRDSSKMRRASIFKHKPRIAREAAALKPTRSRYRGPRPSVDPRIHLRRTDDVKSDVDKTQSQQMSLSRSRSDFRSKHADIATNSFIGSSKRVIRPSHVPAIASTRAKFTLREKEPTTSTTERNVMPVKRVPFRKPQSVNRLKNKRLTSTTVTQSLVGKRRLSSYSNNDESTPSLSRNTVVHRSRPSSTVGRSRSGSFRDSEVRARNRVSHDNNNEVMMLDNTGIITITHVIPAETYLPVVNGKSTELKHIVTARTSTEIVGPQQYTKTLGPNGQIYLALTSESSSINSNGATEVIQYILREVPTTTITFTPTSIRGRKTSFSLVLPSTAYSVEQVISTIHPQIQADTPLANILLSQLLLGNVGFPTNLLYGLYSGSSSQTAVEYITHTSTYVTTVIEGKSTILPLTFQGKKILTTIYDTTAQTITATEFVTDTIVTTPTTSSQVPMVNSLLLQQLLFQHVNDPIKNINNKEISLPLPFPNEQGIGSENSFRDSQQHELEQHEHANGIVNVEVDLSDTYTERTKSRRMGKKHKRKHKDESASNEVSVITLYVSGRRPGEFSTVLSTIRPDNTLHKRHIQTSNGINNFNAYSHFNINSNFAENTAIGNRDFDKQAATQSLQSIVGDVNQWYVAQDSKFTISTRPIIFKPSEMETME